MRGPKSFFYSSPWLWNERTSERASESEKEREREREGKKSGEMRWREKNFLSLNSQSPPRRWCVLSYRGLQWGNGAMGVCWSRSVFQLVDFCRFPSRSAWFQPMISCWLIIRSFFFSSLTLLLLLDILDFMSFCFLPLVFFCSCCCFVSVEVEWAILTKFPSHWIETDWTRFSLTYCHPSSLCSITTQWRTSEPLPAANAN